MEGIIDLRKNIRVFIPDTAPLTTTVMPKRNAFLRGDRALHASDTFTLVHRPLAITVAVVESPSSLYFPTYGSSIPFPSSYHVADRLLVSLASNGAIECLSVWSSEPHTDASWLRTAVQHIPVRPVPVTSKGPALYTRPDVVDHTDLDTFTIDPATSMDFDDAISIDLKTHTVYVHIVDIAHAALTEREEATLRSQCLTLYLANEWTEHLLDPGTASDTLSLVAGLPRSVITVAMNVVDGLIAAYEIYRSTIVVKRRYNYEEVADLLDKQVACPAIRWLADLSNARSALVTYNLTLPSIRCTMNPSSGLPVSVVSESTNDDAHSLVATAMIMANLVVSQHLAKAGLTLPNRFHDTLRGIPVTDTAGIANPVVESFVLVKKFARAKYSVDERGHFGLGLTDYVHFTSPMRRYADVLVHRLLAGVRYAALEGEVEAMNQQSIVMRAFQVLYQQCKLAWWVKEHSDETYDVFCTDVKAVGIQWFLPALSLNGFTHVSALEPTQRWSFHDESLSGASGGPPIRLGTLLQGRVTEVHPVTLSITVTLRMI